MAVTIAEIQKLRKMTGAGLADCKKALTEADGDIEKAIELVRERGLAIAAKRSDRETSNGSLRVQMASLQWLPLSVKLTSLLLVRTSSA